MRQETVACQPTLKETWRRPAEGVLKINFDAAVQIALRLGGWSFVIRDSSGDVVKAGYGHLGNVLEVFHSELLACQQALNGAADLGIRIVFFSIGIRIVELESVSMVVVQAMTTSAFDLSAASD